jgi:hypothetical protein
VHAILLISQSLEAGLHLGLLDPPHLCDDLSYPLSAVSGVKQEARDLQMQEAVTPGLLAWILADIH